MKNLIKIAQGIDTVPLLLALQNQSHWWNQHKARKEADGTPHAAMSDIWLRYNDVAPYEARGDFTGFNDAHESVLYPSWFALPQIRPLVYALMAKVEGTRLGGVMITKIPPGGVIEPHRDSGWHAEYYNTKLYVVLQSNPQCVNTVEDEAVVMNTGDVWFFDNLKVHSVENNGPEDRITLIVCIRCER